MRPRDIPNAISLIRIFLVIPVVYLLIQGSYITALMIFSLAGISDALDGYLAKRFGWESQLGRILDPLADKLLLASTFIVLGWLKEIPALLVILVLTRDVIILLSALAYQKFIGKLHVTPRLISKVNTCIQIACVIIVIAALGGLALPEAIVTGVIVMTMVSTVLSGLDYLWVWGIKVTKELNKKA